MSDALPDQALTLMSFAGGGGVQTATARDDRRFRLILALTFLAHASMLIGFNATEPRRLGAEGGADEAISVSIITEADLRGNATVEDFAAGRPSPARPAPIPTPPTPPVEAAPQPQPQAQPQPLAQPEAAPQSQPTPDIKPTLPPTEETAEKAPQPAEAAKKTEQVEEIKPTPELLALPDPAAPKTVKDKPEPTKDSTAEAPAERKAAPSAEQPVEKPKAVQKPQERKTAKLDLTPPAVFQAPVGGGGAGVQRPAGITRSGENDDFARGVIRALQTTMPQLRDTRGRVTVRITLSMQGDLVTTEVLKPSTVAGLDQSVVFATRQSSFPFPPHNAKPVDLVFIVTYIYR